MVLDRSTVTDQKLFVWSSREVFVLDGREIETEGKRGKDRKRWARGVEEVQVDGGCVGGRWRVERVVFRQTMGHCYNQQTHFILNRRPPL